MKTKYISLLIAPIAALLLSCSSEIEDGTSRLDSLPDVKEYGLNHPCMLHTQSDFDYVIDKIQQNQSPWIDAYNHLCASTLAQSSYQMRGPVKRLARLDHDNWYETYPDDWSNYTKLMNDAAAAYQLALRWKLGDNEACAKKAVEVLNAWAAQCEGYIVNDKGEFIDPNEYLIAFQIHQLANAAEILRDYDGWKSAEFEAFKSWMKNVFYKHASSFLSGHATEEYPLHAWYNWDLANMTAVLSIGILLDDSNMINEAILYFQHGRGSGGVNNGIPFVFGADENGIRLAQCQESGRDQGHATLCVPTLAAYCQMAWNIGEDLFGYDNNRVLAMCEYVAKYNFRESDTAPFKYSESSLPYQTLEKMEKEGLTKWEKISSDGRGTMRPGWELLYSHYAKVKNVNVKYVKDFVDRFRNSERKCEGGAPDYGVNSSGFDQLGWGTLMHARD